MHATTSRRSALLSAASYFGPVFGAGFLLGMARVVFVVPRIGERLAELIEMPFMFAVIYFASRGVTRPEPHRRSPVWIGVGVAALILLLAAEIGLTVLLQDRTLAEYVYDRDPVSGTVYLLMLGVFVAMPWLQTRGAARRPHSS